MNITLIAAESFDDISAAVKDLINQMWTPCLAVAGALTLLWGIFLGYKFWIAGGDEAKKKSAKSAVISFVVGILVIFAVAVGAPMAIGALSTWAGSYN